MSAKIIKGDLFDSDAKYIVHQCNCVTSRAVGLAAEVFRRYPYADIYKTRTKPDKPGTIIVRGNGEDQRFIINLLGQYYPGKPKYLTRNKDNFETRKRYFFLGLKKIAEISDLESVAFPWGIGCGIAGGDWFFYNKLIDRLAKYVNADVRIYKHIT